MKSTSRTQAPLGEVQKTTTKKRALTADALLRMQEEPASKRMRVDDVQGDSGSEDEEETDDDGEDGMILGEESPSGGSEGDGRSEEDGSEEDEEGGSEEEDFGSEGGEKKAPVVDDEDEDDSDDYEPFSLSTPHNPTEDRFASVLRNKDLHQNDLKSKQNLEKQRVENAKDQVKDLRDVDARPPPIQSKPPPVTTFTSLGISSPLRAALKSMSITSPTEVQTACIPPILAGRDCIGNAKTGSGKTIAFALPILQKLLVDPYGIFALVLTPTRELAFQIAEQFAVLGGSVNVRTAIVVGGMDMMAQALELDGRPHIVIATPGRMVDHLRSTSGGWDLSRVKFLVLDEADRLLTPTFSAELAHIFGVLPKERQTCLFTATLTQSIETLAEAPPRPGKMKPFVHRMKEGIETVSTLKQHYILVPSHVREAYLFRLLCNPPESTTHLRRGPPEPEKKSSSSRKGSAKKGAKKKASSSQEGEIVQPPPTIIFCSRAKSAAYLTLLLKTLGIRSTSLHSRLTQRERLSSLQLFKASVVPVLVSTDVGARGLDIPDVAMVVNWDMPDEPEEYTHRVGRTARAGKGGVAISFVTERDEERVLKIEKRINTQLQEMKMNEEKVLEKLNAVSTAKRVANMELFASDFGKREEINRAKRRA